MMTTTTRNLASHRPATVPANAAASAFAVRSIDTTVVPEKIRTTPAPMSADHTPGRPATRYPTTDPRTARTARNTSRSRRAARKAPSAALGAGAAGSGTTGSGTTGSGTTGSGTTGSGT